jgi:hypothetical protein
MPIVIIRWWLCSRDLRRSGLDVSAFVDYATCWKNGVRFSARSGIDGFVTAWRVVLALIQSGIIRVRGGGETTRTWSWPRTPMYCQVQPSPRFCGVVLHHTLVKKLPDCTTCLTHRSARCCLSIISMRNKDRWFCGRQGMKTDYLRGFFITVHEFCEAEKLTGISAGFMPSANFDLIAQNTIVLWFIIYSI